MKMSLAEIDVGTKRLDNGRCFPFTLDLGNIKLFNTSLHPGKKKKKKIAIQSKIETHNNNN